VTLNYLILEKQSYIYFINNIFSLLAYFLIAQLLYYLRIENAEGYVLIAVYLYLFIYLYACYSHN